MDFSKEPQDLPEMSEFQEDPPTVLELIYMEKTPLTQQMRNFAKKMTLFRILYEIYKGLRHSTEYPFNEWISESGAINSIGEEINGKEVADLTNNDLIDLFQGGFIEYYESEIDYVNFLEPILLKALRINYSKGMAIRAACSFISDVFDLNVNPPIELSTADQLKYIIHSIKKYYIDSQCINIFKDINIINKVLELPYGSYFITPMWY